MDITSHEHFQKNFPQRTSAFLFFFFFFQIFFYFVFTKQNCYNFSSHICHPICQAKRLHNIHICPRFIQFLDFPQFFTDFPVLTFFFHTHTFKSFLILLQTWYCIWPQKMFFHIFRFYWIYLEAEERRISNQPVSCHIGMRTF